MAQHRHKRDANARRTTPHDQPPVRKSRIPQLAGSLAVLATVGAVSLGVVTSAPEIGEQSDLLASSATGSVSNALSTDSLRRETTVSRSQSRALGRQSERALDRYQAMLAAKRERAEARREAEREAAATERAVRNADTRLWTTEDLNLWTAPDGGRQVGTLDAIEKVLVTGRKAGGRVELVVGGESRWVSAGYLSDEKPDPGPTLGGSCTNGTSVPSGVHQGIVLVHQAVCANFPSITSYGTFRGDGEHAEGRAVDIMVSGSLGWEVAEFLRANYAALDIEYLIYSQRIWSVERGGEGWRGMSDRGSITANHYDHVHVTVY
ncbi:ligand-binding protein SH3 [Nocardioides gansuensis]|uniref:Ligand-binding protein SH3 n=1 Tax=Nocardioides gansuensis TaxID=2138300 RepID=A0A2T8FCP4_9ACTN|nr:SH3 domain-containing protein [Nocardioides gansuensis]PVG83473.1 ligand-binding protein SH3 [Nocardioides gansuensis]